MSEPPTTETDCAEGCSDECQHKWEISPHPYSSDFDAFVCDDDHRALEAIHDAAQAAWDRCEEGDKATVTIKRNTVTP